MALGQLADDAWQKWRATANGSAHSPPYAHVTHPTQPESAPAATGPSSRPASRRCCELEPGAAAAPPADPAPRPPGPLVPYGDDFKPGERVEIPERDVPAGVPAWMRSPKLVGAAGGEDRRRQAPRHHDHDPGGRGRLTRLRFRAPCPGSSGDRATAS